MINELTRHALDRWPTWFGHSPGEVSIALGSGGPAHKTRAAVFVFEGRSLRPAAVMKIAFTDLEAGFLRQEFDALSTVRPPLPAELQETIPEALDLSVIEGSTVMTMRALPGRRLLVPELTGSGGMASRSLLRRFFRRSFDWSKRLADTTRSGEEKDAASLAEIVHRFVSLSPASRSVLGRIESFGDAVGSSQITWSPTWQHGDLAVGNVLDRRGNLLFLDWEHASDHAQPWFDIAQAPGATSRLAKRQSGAESSRVAALAALGKSGWAGAVLRSELERSWDHPIPIGWAVALTSMATAIRQSDDIRMGAEDWTELSCALVADDELRSELSWLVPDW